MYILQEYFTSMLFTGSVTYDHSHGRHSDVTSIASPSKTAVPCLKHLDPFCTKSACKFILRARRIVVVGIDPSSYKLNVLLDLAFSKELRRSRRVLPNDSHQFYEVHGVCSP